MAVQSHAAFCALLELTPAEAMEVVHNFPLDPVQERPVPAAVEGKLDDAVAEELEVLQLDRGQTVGLFEGPLGKVVPSTMFSAFAGGSGSESDDDAPAYVPSAIAAVRPILGPCDSGATREPREERKGDAALPAVQAVRGRRGAPPAPGALDDRTLGSGQTSVEAFTMDPSFDYELEVADPRLMLGADGQVLAVFGIPRSELSVRFGPAAADDGAGGGGGWGGDDGAPAGAGAGVEPSGEAATDVGVSAIDSSVDGMAVTAAADAPMRTCVQSERDVSCHFG